ncbi:hypothetical protein [Kribbella caucasensis]|uniref:hypothetical protein n=1 Tax=Kribbella caucasensis TaxID=2512215 RepID=UPI0010601C49|nr:hypothetical protein [Kribbella sp. VKM Ac-2527]
MRTTSVGLSDESLLAGLASADPDTAAAFVRRFQGRVFGLAYAILGDREVATEVAHGAGRPDGAERVEVAEQRPGARRGGGQRCGVGPAASRAAERQWLEAPGTGPWKPVNGMSKAYKAAAS